MKIDTRHWSFRTWRMCTILLLVIALVDLLQPRATEAQQAEETGPQYEATPVLTDSPRDVLETFLCLRDDMEAALLAYTSENSGAGARRLSFLSDQMVALFDLEQVPSVNRRETGI